MKVEAINRCLKKAAIFDPRMDVSCDMAENPFKDECV